MKGRLHDIAGAVGSRYGVCLPLRKGQLEPVVLVFQLGLDGSQWEVRLL